jgi:hypothetical protein
MEAFIKTLLTIFLMTALVFPAAAFGEVYNGQPPAPAGRKAPPLEQPLVPEGAFAVQLVQALNLGQTEDEAQAENMLSAAGIEPKNGWIAGYPLTPPIIVEIEKGVAGAADAGKLAMGKDRALQAVADLKSKLGLSIAPGPAPAAPPEPAGKAGNTVIYKYIDKNGGIHFTDRYESIPREYRDKTEMIQQPAHPQVSEAPAPGAEIAGPAESPEGQTVVPSPPAEVVNNYYDNPGPPVITYYAPPPDYYYLYSWVPYPFWCSGFYFGGFFILNDFYRHVVFHGRRCFVSNHFYQSGHRQFYTVDPAGRGLSRASAHPSGVFRSPAARSGARRIYASTQNRTAPAPVSTPPRVNKARRQASVSGSTIPARPGQGRAYGQAVRTGKTPAPAPRRIQGRTYRSRAANVRPSSPAPARAYSAPPVSPGRVYPTPQFSSGGYSAPAKALRGGFSGFRGGGVSVRSGFFGGARSAFGGPR